MKYRISVDDLMGYLNHYCIMSTSPKDEPFLK